MKRTRIGRLRVITLIYWLLLIYIIVALAWWFIVLERQNQEMASLKYQSLSRNAELSSSELYQSINRIDLDTRRNTGKYISEGITFLIFILIGASFVYQSVRKQFRLQLQEQNFMMAVTHELKTPISVITLNLETLKKHNLDQEMKQKLIQTTLKETLRLNTLTNNILVSSQFEHGGYKPAMEDIDLTSLFSDSVAEFRSRHPDRVFEEMMDPDVEITGDPLLIQLMINNLLENAVKYSARGKPVTCILAKTKKGISLSIADKGEGIPITERKKIFEKFYRIGNESTRTTTGTGLGLYLCSKIAKQHHADILVTNNEDAGSTFTINFKS